jgi:chromosome segregation ATPase
MKVKGQFITEDGFDKIVAEKMPKIKQQERPLPMDQKLESQALSEIHSDTRPLEKEPEEKVTPPPLLKRGMETEPNIDVLRLIEDLHTQLLTSSRTKRALEMDLSSSQKTIQQLAQDNKTLRSQMENLRKEVQKLKEIQAESIYLQEENIDALDRIHEIQHELRTLNETLTRATQERDEALSRIGALESQLDQNELAKIKGRLRERETTYLSEENRDLQFKLEEALVQNAELQKKYEALRKSFDEVKESLTLLRDACKSNYYNLSDPSE